MRWNDSQMEWDENDRHIEWDGPNGTNEWLEAMQARLRGQMDGWMGAPSSTKRDTGVDGEVVEGAWVSKFQTSIPL